MATTPIIKISYSKPALTPQQILVKLKAQGLIVPNDALAQQYLTFIGHYRLKGYWYQLIDPQTKQFRPNTTFSEVIQRYDFDRELRQIIFTAIERLEIALRTVICNFLSREYADPHWYLNVDIFKPTRKIGYGDIIRKMESEVGQSHKKTFISAYYDIYDEPHLPPSWAMSECVTMGIWSKIYQILKNNSDQKQIAQKFRISNEEAFQSWIHAVSVMRNMAAHHSRFLHNGLDVKPINNHLDNMTFINTGNIYAGIAVINILLSAAHFNLELKQSLIELEQKYGSAYMHVLGFPSGWKTDANHRWV